MQLGQWCQPEYVFLSLILQTRNGRNEFPEHLFPHFGNIGRIVQTQVAGIVPVSPVPLVLVRRKRLENEIPDL